MINRDIQDTSPIYQQIKEQTKTLIISGALKENEKIPSVRDLAMTMTINPNTIQKAYKELEGEGYIYSVKAKGYYVAPSENFHIAEKTGVLLQNIEKNAQELNFLGIPKEKIIDLIERIYSGGSNK